MTDTYDSLNRLGTAVAKNLSGSTLWSQTYSYTADGSNGRYGNMSCSGSGLCTSMTYSATTNRIATIGSQTPSYDAAGNLTSDGTGTGTYSYTWNAEGRLATATTPSGRTSTTSFIYNALGERVQLVAPTYTYNYPFDAFGQEIGIHDSSSGWGRYTADIAGRRIFLSGSATRWLFHPNALGSSTMVTDQTGAVVQDATYYPWGQLWQSPGSFGGNWNFAAFGVLEPTTNLYPTPFRRYSSTQGRWLSPDPLAGSGMNPQSLNRYAYVLNRPTSLVDPLGLKCEPDNASCSAGDPTQVNGGGGFLGMLASGGWLLGLWTPPVEEWDEDSPDDRTLVGITPGYWTYFFFDADDAGGSGGNSGGRGGGGTAGCTGRILGAVNN